MRWRQHEQENFGREDGELCARVTLQILFAFRGMGGFAERNACVREVSGQK